MQHDTELWSHLDDIQPFGDNAALDSSGNAASALTVSGNSSITWTPEWNTAPTYYWYTWPQPAPKIRLTLSEVEVLREAARKDKQVRKALEKFGPHIEVAVDFPGPDDD